MDFQVAASLVALHDAQRLVYEGLAMEDYLRIGGWISFPLATLCQMGESSSRSPS
jgi:hypothetical protein